MAEMCLDVQEIKFVETQEMAPSRDWRRQVGEMSFQDIFDIVFFLRVLIERSGEMDF